jgi:hypothetical protein|tara:strand:- start:469 stop:885 length:417 start_codon:yes stop_codon:yes gene_type:complete
MNKSDLIKKIQLALDDNSKESNFSIARNIEKFIDALVVFESNVSEEIFLKTITVLKNSIFDDSINSDYFATKNAKFGDFKDIRNAGFYRRYLHNVKLTSTYMKAYQLTENEYVETFGKKRYASYDSFRIIKNRIIKKE